jgi:hypothetical protein
MGLFPFFIFWRYKKGKDMGILKIAKGRAMIFNP